jgi:hypothetical protein
MKGTTIKSVYSQTHGLIRENPELVSKIRKLATDPENQRSNKYFCTGLQVEGIYLGLDFNAKHIKKFSTILANTMVIENISSYQADLSRVLMRVMVDGRHVANLTEDVSENGAFQVFDGGSLFGPYTDYLDTCFKDSVERAVFIVHKEPSFTSKSRNGIKKPKPISIRMPIIDLDHVELAGGMAELYHEMETSEYFHENMKMFTLEIK